MGYRANPVNDDVGGLRTVKMGTYEGFKVFNGGD